MAKISTYPIANPVSPDDLVIGTSNLSEFPLQTKNFKVSDINALGSTPIPIAVFANSSAGGFRVIANQSTPTILEFNDIILPDATGDIELLSDDKSIRFNTGGVYSFELRFNGYVELNLNPMPGPIPISLPIFMKDFIGQFNAYQNNTVFDDGLTDKIPPLEPRYERYIGWTLPFLPTQVTDFRALLYMQPFTTSTWGFLFRYFCIDGNCDIIGPGIELTIKRFRKLTLEETLKYAEAVGLTNPGTVP